MTKFAVSALGIVAVVMFAVRTPLAGQVNTTSPPPNYAGSWTFDEVASLDNAKGANMSAVPLFNQHFVVEQTPKMFTMKIDVGQGIVVAAYALDGTASRIMSPPSTAGQPDIEVTSHAKWDGPALVVTSTSVSPGVNGPVEVKSTRRFWLDAAGHMVIERYGTPKEMVPSTRSVYTRTPVRGAHRRHGFARGRAQTGVFPETRH